MDREWVIVGTGAVGWIALAALTVLPYALFDPGAVGAYYGVGLAGPNWIALLGAVSAFALVAGTKRRSDPATAAGIAVTFGGFAVVLALIWALPARSVAAGFETDPAFGYHPHAVFLASLLVEAAAGWYARTVLGNATR